MSAAPVILASGSPRREEIFRTAGMNFRIAAADVDETLPGGLDPRDGPRHLARRKAAAVAALYPGEIVVGFDTLVYLEGEVMGKPGDRAEAIHMITALQGKTHEVITGAAILSPVGERSWSSCNTVTFLPLSPLEIERYVDTGEPFDKAGGYAVHGVASCFVERTTGNFQNILGVPLSELLSALRDLYPERQFSAVR